MRIGFDVSQTAGNKAGCGFFADQLITHLGKVDTKNEYILYPGFYDYIDPKYKDATQIDNADCDFFKYTARQLREAFHKNTKESLKNPDIIHFNNFRCSNIQGVKRVMTIYDMAPLDCPEFTTEANRVVCTNGIFDAALYADHIIAISESTKKRFMQFFPNFNEDDISVIHLGNRPGLTVPINENMMIKDMGLEEDFYLAVGTLEPRKNYHMLLNAYSELVNMDNNEKPLYIAGGQGWMMDKIEDDLEKMGINQKVRLLGYVSDEQLAALYRKCYAFIYPSKYEGFGLPVLEAMNHGACVITSNSTSLPEVGGEAVLYIDTDKAEDLVEKMLQVKNNPTFREQLRESAKKRAKLFTWEKAAKKTMDVYERCVND